MFDQNDFEFKDQYMYMYIQRYIVYKVYIVNFMLLMYKYINVLYYEKIKILQD